MPCVLPPAMDSLDFLHSSAPSSPVTSPVSPNSSFHLQANPTDAGYVLIKPSALQASFRVAVSISRIRQRCPVMAAAFDYGRNEARAIHYMEDTAAEVGISFLRWAYTGSYLPTMLTPNLVSLVTLLEIVNLGTIYDVDELKNSATKDVTAVLCIATSQPKDLVPAIRLVYDKFREHDRIMAAFFSYCLRSLLRHELDKDSSFCDLLQRLPLFHHDLCALAHYNMLYAREAQFLIRFNFQEQTGQPVFRRAHGMKDFNAMVRLVAELSDTVLSIPTSPNISETKSRHTSDNLKTGYTQLEEHRDPVDTGNDTIVSHILQRLQRIDYAKPGADALQAYYEGRVREIRAKNKQRQEVQKRHQKELAYAELWRNPSPKSNSTPGSDPRPRPDLKTADPKVGSSRAHHDLAQPREFQSQANEKLLLTPPSSGKKPESGLNIISSDRCIGRQPRSLGDWDSQLRQLEARVEARDKPRNEAATGARLKALLGDADTNLEPGSIPPNQMSSTSASPLSTAKQGADLASKDHPVEPHKPDPTTARPETIKVLPARPRKEEYLSPYFIPPTKNPFSYGVVDKDSLARMWDEVDRPNYTFLSMAKDSAVDSGRPTAAPSPNRLAVQAEIHVGKSGTTTAEAKDVDPPIQGSSTALSVSSNRPTDASPSNILPARVAQHLEKSGTAKADAKDLDLPIQASSTKSVDNQNVSVDDWSSIDGHLPAVKSDPELPEAWAWVDNRSFSPESRNGFNAAANHLDPSDDDWLMVEDEY